MQPLPASAMNQAHLRQYKINEYIVTDLPEGTTIDDLLVPQYWCNHVVGGKLRVNDEITVISPDLTWRVKLWVVDVHPGFAKVKIIEKLESRGGRPKNEEREARAVALDQKPSKFPAIDFKMATKWRVLGFEGVVVKEQINTKMEAEKILADYIERAEAA